MINFSFKFLFERIKVSLYRFCITHSLQRKLFLRRVKSKKQINVVFFASNLSMWRYQHLYDLMKAHKCFSVHIVVCPFLLYSKTEQNKNIQELKSFFNSKQMFYIEANSVNIEDDLNPDLLFYPQYCFDVLPPHCDAKKFRNRLLCAYPYGFNNVYASWAYNNFFQNAAWKLFYPTASILEDSKRLSYNKGRNVVITGYPNADDFLSDNTNDVWKEQSPKKKRVIWAPHFTINKDLSPIFFSTFLNFSLFMQKIALEYSEKIQFVFKPHPRLQTELYNHKDWGKSKTDEYYSWWDNQQNTQLETGNFIDLFKLSDAMIHDCGSFSIEYLYTQKPAMYLCRDITYIKEGKNEVGKEALNAHYIGTTESDIANFIEETVLKNNDFMKEKREFFFKKYLTPPNEKTVAQNTLNNILKSLSL